MGLLRLWPAGEDLVWPSWLSPTCRRRGYFGGRCTRTRRTRGPESDIAPRAVTAKRDLLRLVRAVASPLGKDTTLSSAIHALGIRLRDAASPHLTTPLAPPEEPFGASDGRRACKLNTGSPLPAALRGPVRGNISTDASFRPHTHLLNIEHRPPPCTTLSADRRPKTARPPMRHDVARASRWPSHCLSLWLCSIRYTIPTLQHQALAHRPVTRRRVHITDCRLERPPEASRRCACEQSWLMLQPYQDGSDRP